MRLTDLKDQTERALSWQKLEARQSNLEQSIRAWPDPRMCCAASEVSEQGYRSLRAIDPNDPALSTCGNRSRTLWSANWPASAGTAVRSGAGACWPATPIHRA